MFLVYGVIAILSICSIAVIDSKDETRFVSVVSFHMFINCPTCLFDCIFSNLNLYKKKYIFKRPNAITVERIDVLSGVPPWE